ncbi:MAG: adenosylmethionine decarboxylase [bacterium]|nr:adenosylmethionine decarboxylase [bacterium]
MKKSLGVHIILEFFGCDPNTLTRRDYVERVMLEAAQKANTHSIGTFFHQFKPHGVSGVIIIEESHISIHTWPEHGFAAIDFFYCSDEVDPEKAIEVLIEGFKPAKISRVEFDRGSLKEINAQEANPEQVLSVA